MTLPAKCMAMRYAGARFEASPTGEACCCDGYLPAPWCVLTLNECSIDIGSVVSYEPAMSHSH
jgi:hypothetical protein